MENISDNMPLSDIRNILEKIADTCDRFQMISLNRQLEVARALLEKTHPLMLRLWDNLRQGKALS